MASQPNRRLIAAAAVDVHSVMMARRTFKPVRLPEATWNSCLRLQRLQQKAYSADRFPLAVQRLQRDLKERSNQLASALLRDLRDPVAPPTIPSPHDIVDELQGLNDEFDDMQISLREQRVSAVTPAITLEDVDLGRFRISFWWGCQDGKPAYTVEAVDGFALNEGYGYSHPHVDDDILCAGDASAAIRAAIEQGRICDLFVIVRQVLHTYNPQSAFMQLDDDTSLDCSDCGDSVSTDESCCCDRCDASLCLGCSTICDHCGDRTCFACTSECAACDSRFCATCLSDCSGCGDSFCERCLEDDECCECRERHAEEATDEAEAFETPTQSGTAHAAIHAVQLEQTAVPA